MLLERESFYSRENLKFWKICAEEAPHRLPSRLGSLFVPRMACPIKTWDNGGPWQSPQTLLSCSSGLSGAF